MNRDIMKLAFPEELQLVLAGKCPACRTEPTRDKWGNPVFKDELSINEYRISGLCQECQDAIFKSPAADE